MNPVSPSDALLDRHAALVDSMLEGMPEDEAVEPAAALVDEVRKEGRVTPGWEERRRLQSVLDYWFPLLLKEGRIGEAVAIEPFDASALEEVDEIENPYVGLRAFKVEDGPFFFGRDAEVEEACRFVREGKVLLVTGRSGSGKSSFVHAGLAARLGAEKEKAGRSLMCLRMHPAPGSGARVETEIRSWQAGAQGSWEPVDALVVVDQAEEFFTLLDPGVLHNFCERMQPLRRELGCVLGVVLTARQEYEDHFQQLEEKCAGDLVRFRLKPMDAAALRAVIVEPANRVGLRIQEGVVRALVEETLFEQDGLPLLQFSLSQIWKRRDDGGARRGNTILLEDFQRLGGLRSILQQVAETCYKQAAELGEEERIRRLFVSLFVSGGAGVYVRRRADVEDLEESAEGRARMQQVIGCFTGEGLLLTSSGGNGRTQVEVVHESLALDRPRLAAWLEANREPLRAYTEVRFDAQNWTRSGRNRECLITGRRYRRLSRTLEQSEVALGLEEREFLAASAGEEQALVREREERALELSRLRRRARAMFWACVALAGIGAVVTSGFGVVIGKKAKEMAGLEETKSRLEATKEQLREEELNLRAQVAELEGKAEQLSNDLDQIGQGRLGMDRETRLAWERNVRLDSQYVAQRRFAPYLMERWGLKPMEGDRDLELARDLFRLLVLDPENSVQALIEGGLLSIADPSSMESQEEGRYVLLDEPRVERSADGSMAVMGRVGAAPVSDLAPDHKEFDVKMVFQRAGAGEPMLLASLEYDEIWTSPPKPAAAADEELPAGEETLQVRLNRFFETYFEDLNCYNYEGILARLAPDGELIRWFELGQYPTRKDVQEALEGNLKRWQGIEFARSGDLIVSDVRVSRRRDGEQEQELLRSGYRVWVDYYMKAWGVDQQGGAETQAREFRRLEALLREDPETGFRIVSIFSRQLEGDEMEQRLRDALAEIDFAASQDDLRAQFEPVVDVFVRRLLRVGEVDAPAGKEGGERVAEDVLERELQFFDEKVDWYESGPLRREPDLRKELSNYRARFDRTVQTLLSSKVTDVSATDPAAGTAEVHAEALIAWRVHHAEKKEWLEGVTRTRYQLRVNQREGVWITGVTGEKLDSGGYEEQRSYSKE